MHILPPRAYLLIRRIESAFAHWGIRMLENKPIGSSFRTAPRKQKSEIHQHKLGALSAVLAALCVTLLPGTTIAAPPAEARSTTYNLDIPSQSLKDALQALALASQHKLLYSADLVEGRKSPKLKGEFTTEQAVKVLLSGTDLKYEVTSDGFLLIRATDPPPTTNAAGVDTGDAGSESLALVSTPDAAFSPSPTGGKGKKLRRAWRPRRATHYL